MQNSDIREYVAIDDSVLLYDWIARLKGGRVQIIAAILRNNHLLVYIGGGGRSGTSKCRRVVEQTISQRNTTAEPNKVSTLFIHSPTQSSG